MSFKIDMHVHVSELSNCAHSTAEEMCRAAIKHGMHAICFTDHLAYMPWQKLEELRSAFPEVWLIRGIEVTVAGKEDIVVLGVDHPTLQQSGIAYRELHRIVRQRNGYMSLTHPFRYQPSVIEDVISYPPDTIEVHSRNTGACNEEKIRSLARRMEIPAIHVSDAHWDSVVGIYHIELSERPATELELFDQLRKGTYVCCSDRQRIDERNREVDEFENEIRDLIRKGYTKEEYVEQTGKGSGLYARVARGESFRI